MGQYINAASTTTDMQLTADGHLKNVTLSDMGMRFGLKQTQPIFSSERTDEFVSLSESIGRFELLHVVKTEAKRAPTTSRIPIELCSDEVSYCWANSEDIEIFGDLTTATFSIVVLSFKECY